MTQPTAPKTCPVPEDCADLLLEVHEAAQREWPSLARRATVRDIAEEALRVGLVFMAEELGIEFTQEGEE